MKKLLVLFSFFVVLSCSKTNSDNEFEHPEFGELDIVTDASGLQYPGLDPPAYQYCGPGWGAKMCRFLNKYEGTIWADADNYYSDFSDIRFEKFATGGHFISFFKIDSTTSVSYTHLTLPTTPYV